MNLLEKIREAYAKLAELTTEQLTELRADIIKCRKEYDGADTLENADILTELASIGTDVKARFAAIKQQEQEAKDKAEAARASLDELNDEDDNKDETSTEVVAETPEGEEVVAEEALPIAATAHRSTPARQQSANGPTTRSPELDNGGRRMKLLAASALPGKNFGEEFNGREDLATVIGAKLSRMNRQGAYNPVTILAASWSDLYDESRHLTGNEREDARKLDIGYQQASRRRSAPIAPLAASGGVPLPTNVDYAQDTWATAERPIRDGLDPYAVDRGGLLYRQPPSLSALADATTIWTNANDIDPTDPTTKPVLQITSPDTEQVFIDAVPTRLGFGNLMGQFDPETIAANTDLAMAAAARIAELNLLAGIAGFATGVTTAQVMGASRDIFQAIVKVCAAYRFPFRLARDLPLTVIFPSWILDLIKADRIWELAHDSAGSFDPFAIDDAYIEAQLAKYDIFPIWTLDGLPVNTTVTPNYVTQNFTAFPSPDTGGAAPVFPTEVVWHLFIKGSMQFLDGGRLDLGVVRDSTLDATNDYETFVETFENVANRGFADGVIQVVSSLLPTGASAEGIAG